MCVCVCMHAYVCAFMYRRVCRHAHILLSCSVLFLSLVIVERSSTTRISSEPCLAKILCATFFLLKFCWENVKCL